mgnify:CR=1 FL=1
MRAMLIAILACVCGGSALAWELPATRRAMYMDAMTVAAAGGGKVFLDLKVKVDPDWREDERKLKKYGY